MEILINRVLFTSVLINTSYKYYFILNKDFITELKIPRVRIPLKPVMGFIKKNTKEPGVEITKIAKFSNNIQGYKRNIFTYVMPTLLNLVIIGLLWIKKDDVIIRPITDILIINSYGLLISIKRIPVLLEIKKITVAPFIILVKRARKCLKTVYGIYVITRGYY